MAKSETHPSVALKAGCVLLGLALLATGLFFVVGGVKLAALHGSLYFLIAGLVIVAAASSSCGGSRPR
jgi:quinate dehydrogenase (quinone)